MSDSSDKEQEIPKKIYGGHLFFSYYWDTLSLNDMYLVFTNLFFNCIYYFCIGSGGKMAFDLGPWIADDGNPIEYWCLRAAILKAAPGVLRPLSLSLAGGDGGI